MEKNARQFGETVILIPAYNPDDRLTALLHGLKGRFPRIVIVDDGSTTGTDVLARAGECAEKVIRHSVNRGKGAALKTGMAYVGSVDTITVDADGQHRPEDVVRIAEALANCPDRLVLGVRSFVGPVPLRSRFGNFCTRWLFFLMTGMLVSDTQTGLRGIPVGLVSRVAGVRGDRYEYEMAMLVDARRQGRRPLEVPIETVYLEGNVGSHFHPIRDAFRVYRTLFQFCLSSVLGFLLDNLIFAATLWMLSDSGMLRRNYTMVALVAARVVSSNANFLYNRFVVFRSENKGTGIVASYFSYMGLVVLIGLASYVLTEGVSAALDVRGTPITCVKICVDLLLFFASYWIQKHFVFQATSPSSVSARSSSVGGIMV